MVEAAKVAEKYERGGEEALNDDEKRFLQDRGVTFSEPVPVVFHTPNGGVVSNDPVAILGNMREQQQVDLEAEVQRRVEIELARRGGEALTSAQHQQIVEQTPHTGTANPNIHPTASPINPSPDDLEEGDDEDAEDVSYEDMTNKQLRAEIARRNEGRAEEDKLSLEGKKPDLVATLEADDEADDTEEE